MVFKKWPKTVRRYSPHATFVADHFNSNGVGQLERISTALWVRKEFPDVTAEEQADRLMEIKPHVSLDSALNALETASTWESEARTFLARRGPRNGRGRRGASASRAAA